MPLTDVSLKEIEDFAEKHKHQFNTLKRKTGSTTNSDDSISPSGFDYAILKFILNYCTSLGWDKNEFKSATHSRKGKYNIWKKCRGKKVNVIADNKGVSFSSLDRNEDIECDNALEINPDNDDALENKDHSDVYFERAQEIKLSKKSIKESANESSKSITEPNKSPKINHSPTIASAFGYKGAIIQYKVKVENNTAEPIADVKVNLYVPDVFFASESTKSIAILKPGEGKTVTFEIRPTGECGDCDVSGKVVYYDYSARKTTGLEIPTKTLSIVCPMLKMTKINESQWYNTIGHLIEIEECTREIDMPAEILFTMVSRIVKDMHMHRLEPEITNSQQLFNGVARFYGEGIKGLKYGAQIEVVGGAKKSRLILKTWAEKEDALTGFYHGLLDTIEKRVQVKGYIDDSIVQNFYHNGDNIGTQVKDSIVQRSNIGTGADARKCSECGTVAGEYGKFCNECGIKL